jgi:hypothetical protein
MNELDETSVDPELVARVLAVVRAGPMEGLTLAHVAHQAELRIPQAYVAVGELLATRQVGTTEEPNHYEQRELVFGTSRYWPRDRPPPEQKRRRSRERRRA